MKPDSPVREKCPRLWEAEALEDGRLRGADRTSFERHLASCAVCQRERSFLLDLRQTMTALPAGESGRFAHQQRRARLLRAANELVLSPKREGPAKRRFTVALAGLVVLATGTVALGLTIGREEGRRLEEARPVQMPVVPPLAAPTYDVSSERGGVWTSYTEGTTARVVLTSGTAQFHVSRLEPQQRFLVALPDGEIEVTGTRFTVTVAGDRTESVGVSEGTVVFRRAGSAGETVLGAGEQWSRSAPVAALAPPSAAPPRRPPPPAAAARAGDVFAEAMRSFEAGQLSRADAQLLRFSRDFPNDPRCEDSAFLRAVAHARMGDKEGGRALARAYLAAYPNGLRKSDAEHLVADAQLPTP